jgi:2-keto-4-pentenoate hydratase/2-oxohepta-3-ene-1,7-dioic acid hydratase in catechol pathway
MKIIRFLNDRDDICHGTPAGMGKANRIRGEVFGHFEVTREIVAIKKLLAPVAPTLILGTGLNYRRHAQEGGMPIPAYPVLFVKGLNTLQHPGDPIVIPQHLRSDKVDYECELAVVIGKTCKNVARGEALDYVLGYTAANDVSARDWQLERGGGQWCRGKFFDTFTPLGPQLITKEELPAPDSLRIKTFLNGEVMQDWNTNDMIFDVPALIEFFSGSTTLPPGTVILTGTPHGVGMAQQPPRWLRAGDEVTIEIEQIGRLTNPVVDEQKAEEHTR